MNDREIKRIAQTYKTPLYLYDGDGIEAKYRIMRENLQGKFDIFLSVKANPSLGICQLLQQLGSGIEVASAGELILALEAGFQPKDIIFSGPGKTYEEIEFAIEKGIAALIAESLEEIELIDKISNHKYLKTNIGIRIHPCFKTKERNPSISMMGTGTQFGIEQEHLDEAIQYVKSSESLNLRCFHVYAGSQIFNYNVSLEYFEEIVTLLEDLIQRHNLSIDMIDFGGGFGVPYDGRKNPYDFFTFAHELMKRYEEHEEFLKGKRLIFESGRFLLAESGVYLSKVLYRKEIMKKKFIITDGGMNQNALCTFREKKIRGNFTMRILDNNSEEETVTVAGPLCTPDDIIGRNVTLNKAEQGDILCVNNSGAYGISFSPSMFLGHPAPCEVLVYEGKECVLREHGKFEDILRDKHGMKG